MGKGARSSKYLHGEKISPGKIYKGISVEKLVDGYFNAFNAARIKEAALLFTDKMLSENSLVGMSLSGALTPAGLGSSCVVPLLERGFVDWIVSTGANLYHDTHFGLGMALRKGSPFTDDRELKKDGVVRIYDVLFDYRVLLDTDSFIRKVISGPDFNRSMGTATFHYLLGKYLNEREKKLGTKGQSLLASAYRSAVPVYTPSPGDSSIGMNVAAVNMEGRGPRIDVSLDVTESASIVYGAKKKGEKSGVIILGGGAPKNFLLQTEPHIQEILGMQEKGHDYFIQVTDARPDTGGLSGATPSEAVSWGKIDPGQLPDSVVCYGDSTVFFPLITAYTLARGRKRKMKRLYKQLRELTLALTEEAQRKG